MKNYLFLIVVFALINVFPISCFSQNTNAEAKYQIETLDGNEYFGIILTQTTDTIQFKADKLGEISIPRSEIKKISPITVSEKNGEYWLDNPQSTRYFWAPNGYSLKRGKVIIRMYGYYLTRPYSALPITFRPELERCHFSCFHRLIRPCGQR